MSNPARWAPERGLEVPALQIADVGFVHGPGLDRIVDTRRSAERSDRGFPCVVVGTGRAPVPQLHSGERTVVVDLVDHEAQGPDVLVVPDRRRRVGVVIGRRVDRAVLGADGSPSALGFHLPQRRQRLRPPVADAGAVGHLIETVGRGHGPDLHRLEHYVESGVAGHVSPGGVLVLSSSRHPDRLVGRR